MPTMSDLAAVLDSRMDAPKDESWRSANGRGDAGALEQLYDAYRKPIYTLCMRLLGVAEDAEDAMQATFSRAFAAFDGFRGQSSARTWLYRIAVNEAMAQLRRRKNAAVPLDEQMPSADSTRDVAMNLAVSTALSKLTVDHRAILVLRYWEDLAYEEIAEVLRISLPAVKMRLNRAKSEFRKRYGEDL